MTTANLWNSETMRMMDKMGLPPIYRTHFGFNHKNTTEIMEVRVCRNCRFLQDTYLQYLPDELLDLIFKEVYKWGQVISHRLPVTIICRETERRGNNTKKMIYASANDKRYGNCYVCPTNKNTTDTKHLKKEFRLTKVPHTILAFDCPTNDVYINTNVRHTKEYIRFWSSQGMNFNDAAFYKGTIWCIVDRKKD